MTGRSALAIHQYFFFPFLAFVFLLAEQVAEFAGIKYMCDEDASYVKRHAVSLPLTAAVRAVGSSLHSPTLTKSQHCSLGN